MKYHYEVDGDSHIYLKPTARNEMLVNLTPYLQESPHVRILTNLSKKISSYLIHHPKVLVSGGHHFEDMLLEKFKDYDLTCDARFPAQVFQQLGDLLASEGAPYYVVDIVVMLFAPGKDTAFTMRLTLYKVPEKPAHELDCLLRKAIIDDILDDLCDTFTV